MLFLLAPLQLAPAYYWMSIDLALPPALANGATQELFDFLRHDP
jgi:hypothetical protein